MMHEKGWESTTFTDADRIDAAIARGPKATISATASGEYDKYTKHEQKIGIVRSLLEGVVKLFK